MEQEIKLYLHHDQITQISQLKRLLEPYGATVSYEQTRFGGESIYRIEITYDQQQLDKKRIRNAGRKKLLSNSNYTVGEVRELRKTMTAAMLADHLEISKRTLYRRLEKLKDFPDDTYFDTSLI